MFFFPDFMNYDKFYVDTCRSIPLRGAYVIPHWRYVTYAHTHTRPLLIISQSILTPRIWGQLSFIYCYEFDRYSLHPDCFGFCSPDMQMFHFFLSLVMKYSIKQLCWVRSKISLQRFVAENFVPVCRLFKHRGWTLYNALPMPHAVLTLQHTT